MKRQSLPSAKPMMTTLYRNGVARVAYILIGLVLALGFSPLEVQGHTPLPPVPPVTDPPGTELGPSATITFADATQITTQSTGGRFPLVGLHPGEVIDVALAVPVSLRRNSFSAQPLDGGTIIAVGNDSERGTGASSVRLQIGDQPGLYRVLITAGKSRYMLHFWVADARNPKNNPPVINPGH